MIQLDNVGKTYRPLLGRPVRALDGVSLEVPAGEVFGIAGPNGAGKSTLVAILLGYTRPSDGRVRVGGLPPRAFVERRGVGYLSELVALNPRWRVEEALHRFALLAGVSRAGEDASVAEAIARLGLEEHRAKRVRALSKGNLQRLGLAQALIAPAPVVILDEPTHGLDPVWTLRFRELVPVLRHPERVVLVASHNLDELQRVADRVAIFDHGRVQRVVEVRALAEGRTATRYRLAVAAGMERVAEVFPDATPVGRGEVELSVADLPALNRGVAELLARGVLLAAVAPARSALEEQFREAVGEAERAPDEGRRTT